MEQEFNTSYDVITNLSKFEGEPLSTPYFYGIMLDGEGSKIIITEELNLATTFSLKSHR